MKSNRVLFIILILICMFLFIFGLNFYFLQRLNEQITFKNNKSSAKENVVAGGGISKKITANEYDFEIVLRVRVKQLKPVYLNRNPRYYTVRGAIWNNFIPRPYTNVKDLWGIANSWTTSNEAFPEYDENIGHIIHALQTEEILSARNSPRGTQLKLLLNITGPQTVLFKPKWYSRLHIVKGPVYAGKDRHNAEIFGFYLGYILGFRSAPIVVGRKLSLQHIYNVADEELRSTMTRNGSQFCVFGKCHYCKPSEKICGDNTNQEIEGVLLNLVPGIFARRQSPWQRTYKDGKRAKWEDNSNYCVELKDTFPETRLLDLVDAAIFDFLIQNGDRHHYETRNERVLLLDNGKGFGNPFIDYLDILAPLYQCCIIRRSTWTRILLFSGGSLTEIIDYLLKNDSLYPVVTENHYEAVERRLMFVFAAVEYCFDQFGKINVFR